MPPARNATTLPERPLVVNSLTGNSPTDTSLVHERCEARMRVVYDKTLSLGARLLYVALDDFAGMKAVAWPQQATLAELLGCSEQWIRSQIRELESAGYIQRQRRQRGVRYRLRWPIPTESRVSVGIPTESIVSAGNNPDRNPSFGPTESIVSVGSAVSLYEPDQEPEQPIDRSAAVAWMLEVLSEYPGALARIGYPPDRTIAIACLDAGGWNTAAISVALRETYLRGGRRACASQSWGWFPTVLKNYLGTDPHSLGA
jgi:DNA-binding Lrp family transcriptional regulator